MYIRMGTHQTNSLPLHEPERRQQMRANCAHHAGAAMVETRGCGDFGGDSVVEPFPGVRGAMTAYSPLALGRC
jgi:hypothetical protein